MCTAPFLLLVQTSLGSSLLKEGDLLNERDKGKGCDGSAGFPMKGPEKLVDVLLPQVGFEFVTQR